ncbi:hypothetical protein ASG48_07330 [Aurantimonas sp. Leaf443]|nr:hypothetical protein ASG48_07330 [Aurantimonas sp. Leaf443]
MVPAEATSAYRALRRNILIGVTAVLMMSGSIVGLMAKTVIGGAVIAQGFLAVETGPKLVQHPMGGVVAKVFVADGDKVTAGQPLVQLDTTVAEAQVQATQTSLFQQQARLDRLLAERDGLAELTFPSISQAQLLRYPQFETALDSERRQFLLRREERDGQRSQLRERSRQAEEQVRGDISQLDASTAEIDTVEKEIEGLRGLFKKKLVPYQRLSEMERELSQLKGTQGALRSSIAAGRGKIAEIELQIMQVDQALRAELTDQIASAQEAISTLSEKRTVAADTMARSMILAPQSGVVNELKIHTVGGVIQPAETVMVIVPESDRLVGEVKIRPVDVDQLYAGQDVTLHFSAFDRGTTPALNAELASVSPDLIEDKRTGTMYYLARIKASDEELSKLKGLELVPGMPIEAFVKTSDRTIMSYLTKPLTDQMNRALR